MDKKIQTENQILRIKELINENRLYGKLVDQEFLNEGNPIKGVVGDALEFLKKLNVPLNKIDDATKATLKTEMGELLTSFNNNITIDNIETKLNPKSIDNIYDILKEQTKNKLGAVKVKGNSLDAFGNVVELTPLSTKEVNESIDKFFDSVKSLELHQFNKKYDDLPPKTREIFDTLPNIKLNYVNKYTKKFLNRLKPFVFEFIETLFQPLLFWKTLPEAWKTLFRPTGKKGVYEALSRIFNAQTDLVSKKTMITWFCLTLAKDAVRAYLLCDEYEKPKIEFPGDKKNKIEFTGDKKNTNEIKEQEEEKEKTPTGKHKEGFDWGGEVLLEIVFPKYRLDPLTTVSKIFEKIGWDGLKGMGLIGEDTYSCPTSEEHKNFVEGFEKVAQENGFDASQVKEEIEKGKQKIKEHINITTEKVKEVIGVELKKEGITVEDLENALGK